MGLQTNSQQGLKSSFIKPFPFSNIKVSITTLKPSLYEELFSAPTPKSLEVKAVGTHSSYLASEACQSSLSLSHTHTDMHACIYIYSLVHQQHPLFGTTDIIHHLYLLRVMQKIINSYIDNIFISLCQEPCSSTGTF